MLPSYATIIHALEVPPGNVTEFADMVAAFEAMPPEEQDRRRSRKILYDKIRGQAAMAKAKGDLVGAATEHVPTPYEEWRGLTCEHPLVRRIPGGREALFVGDGKSRHLDLFSWTRIVSSHRPSVCPQRRSP